TRRRLVHIEQSNRPVNEFGADGTSSRHRPTAKWLPSVHVGRRGRLRRGQRSLWGRPRDAALGQLSLIVVPSKGFLDALETPTHRKSVVHLEVANVRFDRPTIAKSQVCEPRESLVALTVPERNM